jgi:hypothetical protein
MEHLEPAAETAPDRQHIAPLLDEAMAKLCGNSGLVSNAARANLFGVAERTLALFTNSGSICGGQEIR